MSRSATDRTLALAGVFQVASLVQELAQQGRCDSLARESSLSSLFRFDAETTLDVFGDLNGIRYGLRQLCQQIDGNAAEPTPALRYTLTLLKLAKQVSRSNVLNEIGESLRIFDGRWQASGVDSELVGDLSALYAKTISQIQPRVIVTGDPNHLRNDSITTVIRALLLAGIRSAVLWQQSGGSRMYLLFSRRRILFEAEKLLNQAQ